MAAVDNASLLGGQLADVALLSTAAGAGGVGLWHAIKHLKKKREQAQAQKADFYSLANTPPEFVTAKQAYNIQNAALPAAGGAGLGALIGAIRAGKGKRLSGALSGGAVGAGLGVAGHGLISEEGRRALGNLVGANPEGSPQFRGGIIGGGVRKGMYYLGLPVVGGLGAAAGGSVVNSLLRDKNEEDNKDKVRQSRDDYFKTLLNDADEKTAFDSALDAVYVAHRKTANDKDFFARLSDAYQAFKNTAKDTAQSGVAIPSWVMGASALGGGLVGAKYMYDKTKAKSQAKLYSAAQQARERMRGLDSPWVDPTELAQIKQLTSQGELPNAVGG